MEVNTEFIIVVLIAVLVSITAADYVALNFDGEFTIEDQTIEFSGFVELDHGQNGTSVKVEYNNSENGSSRRLEIGEEGQAEITQPDGSVNTLNFPSDAFERIELEQFSAKMAEVYGAKGLRIEKDALFSSGDSERLHFYNGEELVLTMSRSTASNSDGAPTSVSMKIPPETALKVKFQKASMVK